AVRQPVRHQPAGQRAGDGLADWRRGGDRRPCERPVRLGDAATPKRHDRVLDVVRAPRYAGLRLRAPPRLLRFPGLGFVSRWESDRERDASRASHWAEDRRPWQLARSLWTVW